VDCHSERQWRAGRSKETTKRSELARWTERGYCSRHSELPLVLRLHLPCTLHGTRSVCAHRCRADERQTLLGTVETDPASGARLDQNLIADRHYDGPDFTLGVFLPARHPRRPSVESREAMMDTSALLWARCGCG
jgi:hypothetical protein